MNTEHTFPAPVPVALAASTTVSGDGAGRGIMEATMDAETRLEEFRQQAHRDHGPMYQWPADTSLEHARLAHEADEERYGPALPVLPDGLLAQRDDRGSDSWCNRHWRIPWASDGLCGACEAES